MIIEGRNAVAEAFRSGMTIEKLCVQKGVFNESVNRSVAEARKSGVKIVFAEKEALDKLSETGRHQGILAVTTEYKYSELEDILRVHTDKGTSALIILLDGVEDPHNLGAVIRVAECAGADGVIIPKHRGAGVTEIAIKTSAGATAYVKVAKVTNINDAIRYIKDKGITVLAADMGGTSAYDFDLKGDIALVIGGEGGGVHTLTKKLVDGVVSLPMLGKINSLNASVAAGALIYEAVRQRIKK